MKNTVFCFLLLWLPLSTYANLKVGNVLLAKGVVTASIQNSGLRTLSKGSEVYLGETIATASDSFVVIKMTDNSKISLRPKSEVTLEKYSVESGKEEALFDLIKGGLRAISGTIGDRRPDQYRVETRVATVGIRGTDFYVRLCENDCSDEERLLGDQPRQSASGGGSDQKELKRLDQESGSSGGNFIQCKPLAEIRRGLYVAVYEGKIFVRTATEEIELEAVEALFAEDREILCMTDIPNFIIEDSFLSKDPGKTVTLFNILRNIDEEEQRCEIPEA